MKIIIFLSIILLLVAGCIEQKTSDFEPKKIPIANNATTTATANEPPPAQTPSVQEEANKTTESGDQIRDAIAKALEKGNRSSNMK